MKTSLSGAINVLGMAKRCRARVLQALAQIFLVPDDLVRAGVRRLVDQLRERVCAFLLIRIDDE